jgi:hypothetical protein
LVLMHTPRSRCPSTKRCAQDILDPS